jgi:hypothetical protein
LRARQIIRARLSRAGFLARNVLPARARRQRQLAWRSRELATSALGTRVPDENFLSLSFNFLLQIIINDVHWIVLYLYVRSGERIVAASTLMDGWMDRRIFKHAWGCDRCRRTDDGELSPGRCCQLHDTLPPPHTFSAAVGARTSAASGARGRRWASQSSRWGDGARPRARSRQRAEARSRAAMHHCPES